MKPASRTLAVLLGAALALMGCASLDRTRDPNALRVQPLQVVRHGMPPAEIYRVGRSLYDQGRDAEAIEAFRQVLMADPLHADAHNALGVVYSMQGKAAAAEAEFRMAIASAPDAKYLRENLAFHLERNRAVAQAPAAVAAASEPAPSALPALPAPPAPAPVTSELPPVTAPVAEYRVEISNGNGAAGLARRVSQVLPQEAAPHPRLTNHKPFGVATSVIQHVEGAEDAARDVNASLPIALPLERVPSLERQAKVRILLGKDFPRNAELTRAGNAARRMAAR